MNGWRPPPGPSWGLDFGSRAARLARAGLGSRRRGSMAANAGQRSLRVTVEASDARVPLSRKSKCAMSHVAHATTIDDGQSSWGKTGSGISQVVETARRLMTTSLSALACALAQKLRSLPRQRMAVAVLQCRSRCSIFSVEDSHEVRSTPSSISPSRKVASRDVRYAAGRFAAHATGNA